MCLATSPLKPSQASNAAASQRARHSSAPASTYLSYKSKLKLDPGSSPQGWLRLSKSRTSTCQKRCMRKSLEDGDLPLENQTSTLIPMLDIPSLTCLEIPHPGRQTTCLTSKSNLPSTCSTTSSSFSRSPDTCPNAVNVQEVFENPSLPLKSLPELSKVDHGSQTMPHRWPSDDPGGGSRRHQYCRRRIRNSSLFPTLRKELLLLIFSLSLLLTGFAKPVEGEICSSMVIKHDVNKFRNLTNCSIIEGHLIIASMNEDSFVEYTFPKLREVTDFVVFYQAQNIAKLNHIFPNLSVIRGNKLVMDFALVIFQMNQMAEIGLTSLTHILRGGVRVEKNRNLCYVKTIDWKKIVSPPYHSNILIEENEMSSMCPLTCPQHCPSIGPNGRKNCWNSLTCQINPEELRIDNDPNKAKCDNACIGGCTGPSQLHCSACKDVMDTMSDGRKNCILRCPESLLKYEDWRCISKEKCSEKKTRFNAETIGMERSFKDYNGQCLENCPANTEEEIIPSQNIYTCKECQDCAKECPGLIIRSLETLKKFEGCTKINGDLAIQISGKNIVDELEKNLGKVTVVTGSLKISRSFPIVSLDFFKSLKEIQGTTSPDTIVHKTHYSLEILENENLQKLFPANSRVQITSKNGPDGTPQKGRAFIHYNQKLCRTEIKNLLETSNMVDPGDKSPDISYGTNGHKSVCSEKVLRLSIESIGRGLQLNFDNYQEEISRTNPKADTRALLNYEIHYREIDKATFDAKNVTKFEGRDACGNDKWMIDDHSPTPQNLKNDQVQGIIQEWPQETTIITDGIKPYSYYAIFVTTLIIREGIAGGEDIKSAASKIHYFHTPEDTPDPPQDVKVISETYSKVNITWQPPQNPNGVIAEYHVEVVHHEANIKRLVNIRPYCDAEYKPNTEELDEKKEQPKDKPKKDVDGTCDCSQCGKTSHTDKARKDKELEKVEEEMFLDTLLNYIYFISDYPVSNRKKRSIGNVTSNIIDINDEKIFDEIDHETDEEIISKQSSERVFQGKTAKLSLEIPNLRHFSKYTVKIKACHQIDPNDGYQRCSDYTSLDFRTSKKEGADDILGPITSNQESNNGTNVWLSWQDPPDPNLVIVHYKIYIQMQHDQINEYTTCITAKEFEDADRKYSPSVTGSFFVSVSAVSLAGPGAKTKEYLVRINEKSTPLLAILLPLLALLCIVAGGFYLYFKKQRPSGDETTCNPIYLNRNFGKFEIPRDLIDRGQKLGTGSFGTVYQGLYRSSDGDTPCAIKEAKNDTLRDQLLDEADRMRCIETPHVVRLLGVVTEGFPQYVILELMDNGDLKNYLRKRRTNRPSPREVYQMAIQVADGMAYLSNVPEPKIIHRDLAARNCMVNGRLVVKIGDFGLARDLCYAQDYYRMHGKDWMPVRWMAPESLVDNVFSQASDVWAYGVVLWELVTLAEQPYQGLSNEEVLNYVRNGNTMEIPTNTPEIIASLMRDCWRFEASDRPTFIDICHRLLEHSHPDFQRDSFITSALCRRVLQQREGILASGDDDLPIEDAELAPLQSNGNGEVRALDNGHAVQLPLGQLGHAGHPDSMRDFDISPRAHNMWERLRKILRNRLPHSNNTTAAQASTTAASAPSAPPTSVEA